MNGWLDPDEFPMTYFATSWVCQFVNISPLFFPAPLPIILTPVGNPFKVQWACLLHHWHEEGLVPCVSASVPCECWACGQC